MRHCKGALFAAWVTALTVAHAGCVYTWSAPATIRRTERAAPIVPRADRVLPGTGELLADGRFRFTVDAGALCTRDRRVTVHTRTTSHRQLTLFGVGLIGVWAGAAGAGGYLAADGTPEGVALAALGIMVSGLLLAGRWFPPSEETKDHETNTGEGADALPCPGGVGTLGTLELHVPWTAGHLVSGPQAAPGAEGVATFDIDWTSFAPDPADPQRRELVARPWLVRSASGLEASWQPRDTDVAAALAQLDRGRDRVVTGPGPPALDLELVVTGEALQPGSDGTLTATLVNHGSSTAQDVAVRTRSNVPELHGLTFTFGRLQPGQRASRSLTVKLPASTRGESATLQVIVTEAGGHVPPERTQQIPFSRSVCPEGRLTRAQYEKKRGKLKAAVDSGNLGQADFDQLDAELLRCLD